MFEKVKEWSKRLKRESRVLQLLYKDSRTPLAAKVLIWITLGYLFSPIDLIPDFIPVLGLLDDIILVPLLITLVFRLIPPYLITEARERVQSDATTKWKKSWPVILFILLLWLGGLYLAARIGMRYFSGTKHR